MNIKQTELARIQNKLNLEFSRSGRKIIFWYDGDGKSESLVDSLEINAKIYHLEKDNTFYAKYLLEIEDKDSNYLIYANFDKPKSEENHMIDTILYSTLFSPDRLKMFMNEANIDEKFYQLLKRYYKFFKSEERKQNFIDLGIDFYNEKNIEVSIMTVLSKASSASFDEIIKAVLFCGVENNKALAEFERIGISEAFWKYCMKNYGYVEDNPDLTKFVTTMLITYAANKVPVEIPSFKKFITSKAGNVTTFISNFMNNILCKELFDNLSKMVASEMKIEQIISKVETRYLLDCDAFECVDKEIIKRCIKMLENESTTDIKEYCLQRVFPKHFGVKFSNEYECLINASKLINLVNEYKPKDTYEEIIKNYTKNDYIIDYAYRKFYVAYDLLEDSTEFESLRQQVENVYTNGYLKQSTISWSSQLSSLQKDNNIYSQSKFYNHNLAGVKDRIIVIISDAFRYECAVELTKKLKKETYEPTLSYMTSTIPSYTSLGMAALLPHKTIEFNNDFSKITVDGMPTVDTKQRNAILCKYDSNSVAISFDMVAKMKKPDMREAFQGKSVIYIYHNQVDARGDKAASENEVFNACNEAISEIGKMIRILTNNISASNYIITADHGFIYKRDKIEESEKVSLAQNKNIALNKRYILSHGELNIDGAQCLPMSNILGKESDVCVSVPIGSDIFKTPGGGQNFVHGGASLQEMLIPLLNVHTHRTKYEIEKVEISMLNLMSGKITNLITNIDYLQNQTIDEEHQSAIYRIYFEDASKNRISNEEQIVANKKSTEPSKRVFRRTFRFKNQRYDLADVFYMVIEDIKTGAEVLKKEFIFDIPFANDFGLE